MVSTEAVDDTQQFPKAKIVATEDLEHAIQREEENNFTDEYSKARFLTLIERFPCRKAVAVGDKDDSAPRARFACRPSYVCRDPELVQSSNVAQTEALNSTTITL